MARFTVEGEVVEVDVDRVVNAGYSGRDSEAVREHVEELLAEGAIAEEPETVPTVYPVAPYTLLVDPGDVTVVGEETSGEAEFGLVMAGGETYVVAASDHTDRSIERHGIQRAKQAAPDVVSREAWRLSDVRDHWDEVELHAHVTVDGERERYQEATLGSILTPEALLDEVDRRVEGRMPGSVVLSGTVPTVDGALRPGERFEVELRDPVRERSLTVAYGVRAV